MNNSSPAPRLRGGSRGRGFMRLPLDRGRMPAAGKESVRCMRAAQRSTGHKPSLRGFRCHPGCAMCGVVSRCCGESGGDYRTRAGVRPSRDELGPCMRPDPPRGSPGRGPRAKGAAHATTSATSATCATQRRHGRFAGPEPRRGTGHLDHGRRSPYSVRCVRHGSHVIDGVRCAIVLGSAGPDGRAVRL